MPQRLVIVLPTTGEHDSRTYRIASFFAARGHQVTVLARSGPGLPVETDDPAGYRIVRVAFDPVDGLPLSALWRPIARLIRGRRAASVPVAVDGADAPDASDASDTARPPVPLPTPPAAAANRNVTPPAGRQQPGRTTTRLRRRLRAVISGAVRIAAIALTIRAQQRAARALDRGADLYHGMAYMGIPVALGLAARAGAPVVYDARDIYLDAGNLARLPRLARFMVGRQERGWARRADRIVTVNRPYAEVMATRWALPLPVIVMNCSYRYEPAAPRPRRFHDLLGLDAEAIVVLYQGGFSPDRGIEQLIAAMPSVPGAVLVLMGYGRLRESLERTAAELHAAGRIHVLPPVAPAELLDWVAAADIVAMPIQPTTLNHRLTTPNKLFEAMAAGIAVIASDLPGMADIVRDSHCGLLVDPTDPAAITAALDRLRSSSAERTSMGAAGLAAAHAVYNWESQVTGLLAEYGRLTGRPW